MYNHSGSLLVYVWTLCLLDIRPFIMPKQNQSKKLEIVPLTFKEAKFFIDRFHRHHRAPTGGLFAIGCACGLEIVGVATVGKPIARLLDDGWTVEVTRVCTNGIPHVPSKLYAACWRAAKAMGWKRLITYILNSEPGTSLKAAGWKCVGECGGGTWNRRKRPRIDLNPQQTKIRYEMSDGE